MQNGKSNINLRFGRGDWVTIISIACVVTAYGFMCKSKAAPAPASGAGFALVELFTSEGCSSCPAADAAVQRLLKTGSQSVYVLAYHVDYWNRFGWVDAFSSATYSKRQALYADRFKLSSIYTPQIVVNGTNQFVGSNELLLKSTVNNHVESEATSQLIIACHRTGNLVNIKYQIGDNGSCLLNFALVEPEAETAVKRGENHGKILHHVNIVRSLQTITVQGNGDYQLTIPKGLQEIPLQLTAFTQSEKTLKVTGVAASSL